MNDIQKKMLLDMLVSPFTAIPVALGASMIIMAWAFSTVSIGFLGFVSLIGGLGIGVSRLVLGLDEFVKKAHKYYQEKSYKEKEDQLDALYDKLSRDGDSRTHSCLQTVRSYHKLLQEAASDNHVNSEQFLVIGQIEDMFKEIIKNLEYSYELYEIGRSLPVNGEAEKNNYKLRKQIVDEIAKSLDFVGDVINKFHVCRADDNASSLSEMRKELEYSIEITNQARQELKVIGKSNYNEAEFLNELKNSGAKETKELSILRSAILVENKDKEQNTKQKQEKRYG